MLTTSVVGTFRARRDCLTLVRNALQSGRRREQRGGLLKEMTLNRESPMSSASETPDVGGEVMRVRSLTAASTVAI